MDQLPLRKQHRLKLAVIKSALNQRSASDRVCRGFHSGLSRFDPIPRPRFNFKKCCQVFVGAHDDSLSVVAVRVRNEDVLPSQSTVATQPQLQPALLRLSAMIYGLFSANCGAGLLASS